MPLGIRYARTQGKAGNRREGKGRVGQGKGWKGGQKGQHKQKNSTIAWRLYENDFGPEEQHVIRVRRDAKVAALAGTNQNKNQQQTILEGTRQRNTQEPAANWTLSVGFERFSFLSEDSQTK